MESSGRKTLGAFLAVVLLSNAGVADAQERRRLMQGEAPPGTSLWVRAHGSEPLRLCAPECSVLLDVGPTDIGFRRGRQGDIDWREIELTEDLRLDVRFADNSAVRAVAYSLIGAAAVLVVAAAIVGIATTPQPPDLGWFGPYHGLVFAGIAAGIAVSFGVPGIALAVSHERDWPELRETAIDESER